MTELAPVKKPASLYCKECGAITEAVCDCNAGYLPAGEYAELYLAENPDRSNRAIADHLKMSDTTVMRARQRVEARAGAANEAHEKRVGRDGKSHPAKRSRPKLVSEAEPAPTLVPEPAPLPEPANLDDHTVFLKRAEVARLSATYAGEITKEVLEATSNAAKAWRDLLGAMLKKSNAKGTSH